VSGCPRCGEAVEGVPALSRWDNSTHVCVACGVDEGIAQFIAVRTEHNPSTAVHPVHGTRKWEAVPDGAWADHWCVGPEGKPGWFKHGECQFTGVR
jgi:hypothetical protein